MREIEQTQKNLNTKDMNENIKREMFDKFKKVGKVSYQGKNSRKTGAINRTYKPKNNAQTVYDEPVLNRTQDIDSKRNQFIESNKKESSSFFNRLAVKFKAKFGGVSSFNGDLSLKFAKQVNSELSKYLLNLRLLQKDINPKTAEILKKEFSLYEFLIRKVFNLYNSEDFEIIQKNIYTAYGSYTSPEPFQEPFYKIFKKLYLLYSYQKIIYQILSAITNNLERKKSTVIYKNIKNEFNLIYSYFFEKLYLFVISYERKNIPIASFLMEETLNITENDKMIELENDDEEDFLEEEEEEEEDEDNEILNNTYLSEGLDLINKIDIENKKLKFLTEIDISNFDDTDKNHLIYVTFKEFDIEYSPILTTNQIKMNEKLRVPQRNVPYNDFRQSIYDSMIVVSKKIESYNQSKNDYLAFKKEKLPNYIIAAKKAKELNTKIDNNGFELRMLIKDILKQVIDLFNRIIKEFEAQNKEDQENYKENIIVLNPGDNLNNDINQAFIFENKTVKEAIIQTYSYGLAFLHNIENNKF